MVDVFAEQDFGAVDEDVVVCPNCGSEHVPRDCPQCGGPALRVTLDAANRTVVACRDCGADFDRPLLRF